MSSKKKENNTPAEETPVKETAAETEAPEVREEPSELDTVKAELSAEKDKYLRLMAEYDNFRKRSARERDNIYGDVKADTVGKLLPVYDNLERALAQTTVDEAYRKGVEMTMNQFTEVLSSMGITPIEAVGKPFDPSLHNAVMQAESEEFEEGIIMQEFQKGFKMGERVIRFSMVQVAK